MNFSEWQTKAETKLRSLATSARQLTPGVLYGALSTATIFPLVEAARQAIGAQNYPLLMSLGALAAGIGGNLVAEQISRWHGTEAELVQELTQKAATDEAWRKALDDILERFDALRVVQTMMSEADKDWFAQTLKTALREVGSRLTVGGDYIQVGNLTNNTGVAIGKQITQIINYYHPSQQGGAPPVDEPALKEQIRTYLRWVCRHYGQVTLRGMRRQGEQAMTLALDTVYVPLAATAVFHAQRQVGFAKAGSLMRWNDEDEVTIAREERERTIELNELLGQGDRLIVTGGPGSGKTTVLQHLAHTLAQALLVDELTLAQTKVGLPAEITEAPIPIVLPLSVYALHRRQSIQHNSQPRTLAAFIADYLVKQQEGVVDLLPDFFTRLLHNGRHLILLLDGLDEVPDEAERTRIREAIERLADGKADLRLVVTCRIAAYQGRTALGRDFREVRVQPLDDDHVAALVQQAYSALYDDDAIVRARQIDELLAGIRDLEAERQRRLGKEVARLIDSPLMVRLLLIVHLNERRFPQHRAELYQRATDNLLWPDYGLEDADALEQIRGFVGQSHEVHRDLVQQIAWELHRLGKGQGREIDDDALFRLLRAAGQPPELVRNFLQLTRVRGTLLEERLGLYRFFHLAFQEFMVARYLAEVVRGEGGVEAIVRLLQEEKFVLQSWWREPILLVAGYLSMNARRSAQAFLLQLAKVSQKSTAALDQQFAAAELAASGCLEWFDKEQDQSLYHALSNRLTSLITNPQLIDKATPRLCVEAGVTLGHLGDQRLGIGVKNGLPDLVWSKTIEPGQFIMGGNELYDGRLQFTCNLITHPYRISRYPVTVMQYRTFIEANGYAQFGYWTKAGWQWRQQEQIEGPEEYHAVFQTPNHPQVGVSWYEAVAFCNWLTDRLKHPVRLATEAEWERAARYVNGRNYPWGEKFDAKLCNMDKTGLDSTSAVGLFPSGDALCGAADMSGNVLEWCSTLWLNNYEKYDTRVKEDLEGDARRVLRGGSFIHDDFSVRCAFRYGFNPAARLNYCGFRVVLPDAGTPASENSKL
jgi:formylglycine-generating enzyme required for sulfatase activity/energy-coupling factor transporter ATP-binding protein EcfA2